MKHAPRFRKCATVLVAVAGLSALVVACGEHEQACADPIAVVAKGSGSGGGSGGGSRSGGASSGGSKSGSGSGSGSKSGSGSGSKSGSGSGSKSGSGSGSSTQSKTAQQARASSASKPTAKPAAEDVSKAKSEAPPTVSRGGNYTSSVTGNTYVFHSVSYYRRPGIYVDIWDPYNPYNYWYWPASPFYGRPYSYAGGCGQEQKQVSENKQDINITIDNDGKVVQADDKNPQDPDLVKADPHDDDPPDPPPPATEAPTTVAAMPASDPSTSTTGAP